MIRTVVSMLALAVVLVACGTGGRSRPIVSPDGTTWWRIECRHREGCPAEAQSRCPDGYVKGEDSDKGGFNADGSPSAKIKERRTMTVKCVSKARGEEAR